MQRIRYFALLSVILSWVSCAFAQTTKEVSRLADQPSGKTAVSTVPANATVSVLERQGFWVKVQVAGQTGWIKASVLSFSTGAGGATSIDTGRLGKGNIVATSAARGLSAKDLLEGKPNPKEVERLAAALVDDETVQAFLQQGEANPVQLKVSLQELLPPKPVGQTDGNSKSGSGKADGSSKKGKDDW